MFMTIGGDGTILKWGQKAAACNKLLLGINTGRLGFMTSIESGELDTLERLKTGEYTVSRRMMLDIEYEGKGNYSAINDVVFSKCRYSIYCFGRRIRGDKNQSRRNYLQYAGRLYGIFFICRWAYYIP